MSGFDGALPFPGDQGLMGSLQTKLPGLQGPGVAGYGQGPALHAVA